MVYQLTNFVEPLKSGVVNKYEYKLTLFKVEQEYKHIACLPNVNVSVFSPPEIGDVFYKINLYNGENQQFVNRSDTIQAVQPHKMARDWK